MLWLVAWARTLGVFFGDASKGSEWRERARHGCSLVETGTTVGGLY